MQLTKQSELEITMANSILSAAAKAVTNTPQYQLGGQARQAILAQSDSARTSTEIEQQRTAFCSSHLGCAFGQNIHQKRVK
jgi:hypothetical protein